MSRKALLGVIAAAALGIGAARLAAIMFDRQAASSDRPVLLLLTSLPLLFGEEFSLDDTGSDAATALSHQYRLTPISVSDPAELAKGGLLLAAQPHAQRPDDLVALDAWVRSGGRLLLLADPMLEWPSQRPLGDRLRPLAMFMDSELLAHWGVRLESADRGPATRRLGGYAVATASPGALSGRCAISTDRFVARCRVGKGRVTVIADADLLDTERMAGSANNLDALLGELRALRKQ